MTYSDSIRSSGEVQNIANLTSLEAEATLAWKLYTPPIWSMASKVTCMARTEPCCSSSHKACVMAKANCSEYDSARTILEKAIYLLFVIRTVIRTIVIRTVTELLAGSSRKVCGQNWCSYWCAPWATEHVSAGMKWMLQESVSWTYILPHI